MHNIEDCIFCKIANKKIPAEIIKETGNFIVIKDINPVAPVHLLIISKKHYDSLIDGVVDTGEHISGENCGEGAGAGWNEIFYLIARLARELKLDDKGFRTVINTGADGGQTVGHLHIHFMAGRQFGWPPG